MNRERKQIPTERSYKSHFSRSAAEKTKELSADNPACRTLLWWRAKGKG